MSTASYYTVTEVLPSRTASRLTLILQNQPELSSIFVIGGVAATPLGRMPENLAAPAEMITLNVGANDFSDLKARRGAPAFTVVLVHEGRNIIDINF